MGMNVGHGSGDDAEPIMDINTTPLIDLMLVLLVMLIITIPIQLHSVNLNMPVGTPPPSDVKPEVVKIDIDEKSVVYWQGLTLSGRAELEAKMEAAAAQAVQPEIHIRPNKGETRMMRSKEDAHDYRYFPDPDLLPLIISPDWKARVKTELPELPGQMRERFVNELALSVYDATTLTASQEMAGFFESTVSIAGKANAKPCANWVMVDLAPRLNKEGKERAQSPVSPAQLGGLILRIADNTVSNSIAKKVFDALWNGGGATADEVIDKQGLKQITDSGAIESLVDEVLVLYLDPVQPGGPYCSGGWLRGNSRCR